MALFIAIEGPDTSGKSTQAQALKEWFESKGEQAKIFHFPSEKGIGNRIQSFLKGEFSLNGLNDVVAIQMVYLADMLAFQDVINETLKQEVHVIVDRYTCSTYVYGRSMLEYHRQQTEEMRPFTSLNSFLLNTIENIPLARPDMTFILDLPVEEIKQRKETLDYIESKEVLMSLVCQNYRGVVGNLDYIFTYVGGINKIDATLPIETIQEIIQVGVMERCR